MFSSSGNATISCAYMWHLLRHWIFAWACRSSTKKTHSVNNKQNGRKWKKLKHAQIKKKLEMSFLILFSLTLSTSIPMQTILGWGRKFKLLKSPVSLVRMYFQVNTFIWLCSNLFVAWHRNDKQKFSKIRMWTFTLFKANKCRVAQIFAILVRNSEHCQSYSWYSAQNL